MAKRDIPIFDASLDPELGEGLGVNEIAFVNDPAVMIKGVAFAKQAPKMRIAAPILVPMNVYRYNEIDGEYEIRFTAEEIENIGKDFQSKSKTAAFNLEHQSGVIAPAYLLETWFVGENTKADRSWSEFGVDVPAGTWFGVAQITGEKFYNELVQNEQTGFSIEGFLGMKITQNKQYKKMNKQFKLADVKTITGDMLFIDGDIAIGSSVFLITPSGEKVIPQDGDIQLEDGTTISTSNGLIEEISAPGEEISDVEEEEMKSKPTEMVDGVSGPTEAPTPADAPISTPMGCTPEEVNKMIEDKMVELVAKIAELQTKIDNMEVAVPAPKSETKMSIIGKYITALNN
jgi:hypothetical protein